MDLIDTIVGSWKQTCMVLWALNCSLFLLRSDEIGHIHSGVAVDSPLFLRLAYYPTHTFHNDCLKLFFVSLPPFSPSSVEVHSGLFF